jgi:RimJ/RimL family protein N-acetyltransferase
MLRYVYGHDQVVADFVARLIPHARRGFGKCKAIGIIDERGVLIAGLCYHNYDPEAGIIEMSGAATSRRWLTAETIGVMYRYPFLQVGVQMVVMRIRADNEHLLRQLAQADYSYIKVPRLFGREHDGVLALLTREAWEGNKFCRRYGHHLQPIEQEEAA